MAGTTAKIGEEQIIMILRRAIKCKNEPGCIDNDEFITNKGRHQAADIGLRRTLGGKHISYHRSMIRTRDAALLAFANSSPNDAISKPCLPGFNEYVRTLPIVTSTILVTNSYCLDNLGDKKVKHYPG